MSKHALGIDLGTSAVKLLLWKGEGNVEKARAAYSEISPKGWLAAIGEAAAMLDLSCVSAIGLSSQVGTYVVNGQEVISWNEGAGAEELAFLKEKYSKETFIREIAMPHPDIVSYPLPRLLYIKKNFPAIESVCQPKDLLCKALCGRLVSEKYSWRGLAHTKDGGYSAYFLREIGIDENILPPLIPFDAEAGKTTAECEAKLHIPKGIPVYTGLNDFFASLLGMGIEKSGDMFDITGTSEHLGLLSDTLAPDTKMVSGVYFDTYIHYGVTGSSGASSDFAIREFGRDSLEILSRIEHNPPIFTPYVKGERAPIFDSAARGVFFGVNAETTREDMLYAVMEGIAFSLYHIYESMGTPPATAIRISGGAAKSAALNLLKAELFGKEVCTLSENDTSALGAAAVAARGAGIAPEGTVFNRIRETVSPKGDMHDMLLARYAIYKELYPSLSEQFTAFTKLERNEEK